MSELEQLIADLNKPGIHTSATGAQLAKALQGLHDQIKDMRRSAEPTAEQANEPAK